MRDKPGYIVLVAVGINQNVPNISQGTLFFAETKDLNFSLSLRLRSQTHKFFNVRSLVVGGIIKITATDRKHRIKAGI